MCFQGDTTKLSSIPSDWDKYPVHPINQEGCLYSLRHSVTISFLRDKLLWECYSWTTKQECSLFWLDSHQLWNRMRLAIPGNVFKWFLRKCDKWFFASCRSMLQKGRTGGGESGDEDVTVMGLLFAFLKKKLRWYLDSVNLVCFINPVLYYLHVGSAVDVM